MSVSIVWQQRSGGLDEVWALNAGCRRTYLFTLASPGDLELVERWAEQADSLAEFLEMMHLEELIDLDTLRHLLSELSPLYRVWAKLRAFCQEAGDIGEYPAQRLVVGSAEVSPSETAIRLPEQEVTEALAAWMRFEAGEDQALNAPSLGVVVAELGCLAGERFGLPWPSAMHFGDWLTGVITGWPITHGNEEELWRLEGIAAQAAAGAPQHLGPACYKPEVWEAYRPVIAAVVRALRQSG